MKVFFTVTIDTEIDRSPDWKVSKDETFFSVLEGVPQKLTPLLDRFGAKPTYLLSSEIMEDNNCVNVLENIQNCELGTHLHGDLIEPQRKIYKLSGTYNHAMQNFYSQEIEYQKLKTLTDLFIKKFGYQPKSFRAGRFAAGNNTSSSLEKLGYLVDSSVTPGIDWNYPEGRANFFEAPEQPYFSDAKNLLKRGNCKLLEVPVTIFNPVFRKFLNRFPYSILNMIANKFFPPYWLRPSFQKSEEMIFAIKKIIKRYQKKDKIVLNMMFHSMEIMPGASPYNQIEEEVEEFLEKIEKVLGYCKTNKFEFVSLSELYHHFLNHKS